MNLRRKSRCKLKIFGSFGGSKSRPRQYRSEADLTTGGDKSVPVLLGIKHNSEDLGSLQHLHRVIDRHSSLVAIPEQRTPAPSRSYSMCCDTKPIIRQNEPGSLPHHHVRPRPRVHDVTRVQLASLRLAPEEVSLSRRSPSVTDDSMVSDSNYDSGAFSRTSTPELGAVMRHKLSEVAPLLSPPLVLSVSRRSHNPSLTRDNTRVHSDTLPMTRVQLDTLQEARASPVTVTIGASTRLCVNDEAEARLGQPGQYQSLPNLARSDTRRRPHMGTARLLTPPKPPRARSALVSHNTSLERPRPKITTSTSVLRSNTSVGFNSFVGADIQRPRDPAKLPPPALRSVRDSSCGSDTSSGVFSVGSLETHSDIYRCKVTVNGQHL